MGLKAFNLSDYDHAIIMSVGHMILMLFAALFMGWAEGALYI
jgi:hypothetical protein